VCVCLCVCVCAPEGNMYICNLRKTLAAAAAVLKQEFERDQVACSYWIVVAVVVACCCYCCWLLGAPLYVAVAVAACETVYLLSLTLFYSRLS